ncbi:MAG: hypothetical protein FWG54_03400 [Bacteroidetes bacterium]|nr:hypothetical protein [Bacteroidota bacterium]
MNTHFKIITVALAIAFGVVSCGGKGGSVDTALSRIEKAMDKVEKNKTSMTEADWKELGTDLEEAAKILTEALESDQVGVMKKMKISAVMLRYALVAGEAALHTAADSLKVQLEDLNLQKLLDSDEMKDAVQEMQKASEELQKLIQ